MAVAAANKIVRGDDLTTVAGEIDKHFQRKVNGKGLSTNDYTTEEKTKLAGIESGAQKNVKPDWDAASGDAQILNKPATLSGYGITNAYTKAEVDTAISNKQDTISDLDSIRSGAAAGATAVQPAALNAKQDTIADLSSIRSGAALGETSVQPVDIENMVEAEPIGSIIPPVNPSEFSTTEEVSQLRQEVTDDISQLKAEKFDKTAADDTFYITDSNGNIIVQIDNAGVSSVDVKVKVDGVLVSAKSLISSLSGNISTVAGSVAAEKTRAETEEAKKLDHTLTDDALVIADSNGNIIAKIDACGISSPDVLVGVDGNLVSVKTLIAKKIDQELADDSLEIMDSNGYVIFKIDASGVHSAKDKHAVACMVLGEYYYPTATPTRDTNGNITHVAVMFGTGIAGTLDITYTDGNASQVVVEYGDYTYTISISRDAQGNVETVTVN